ncbi:MAG: cell division protein FtsW [Anaerohalosphaera sp.]|nr:cell division protein FtsW [Anaerohalosphaera sp.]
MLKTTKDSRISLLIEMVVLILMAIGTSFVFSAGAKLSTNLDLRQFYQFTTLKQILFFPLAVAIMYIFASVDYKRFSFTRNGFWRSFTPYLLAISILLLILVLIPGIGVVKNQSRRWLEIAIGPAKVSFQPSELAKWITIFFFAAFLDKYGDNINQCYKRFIPTRFLILCTVAAVTIGLIITQDFGSAALIALLCFLMMFIGKVWLRFLLPPVPIAAGLLSLAVLSSPTRINRIKTFYASFSDPSQLAYQAKQSLIAISTAGILGRGYGRGVSKYGHLPEDTTDFIFAIICEEMGFAGAACVIFLFTALLVLGIILVKRCDCTFGKLLAAGIVLSITIQAAINIGVVTVVLPTKGIPLPFISAGGTSMLLTATMVGVLLNIARQTANQDNQRLEAVND